LLKCLIDDISADFIEGHRDIVCMCSEALWVTAARSTRIDNLSARQVFILNEKQILDIICVFYDIEIV